MGNCFSDPSKAESKGQKLGSGPSTTAAPQSTSTSNKPTSKPTAGTRVTSVPPQTLGGGLTAVDNDGDARERALRAAEERAKAAKKKGVNTSNPKAGQLSAKLDADRKASSQPQAPNERMMDQGQWN